MDRIADFQQGRDQIDLSALLGDTDLAWGDETALVKGAWQLNTGSGLYLLADTSGDGVADFKVELKYSCGLTLTANDILGVSGSTLAAANDSVDTTEDSAPFSFAVTGNDVGELLSVLSLDTTGTKGSVALNADGSISYGPSGQFEYLAQGDIAFDTFSYTVQDAHGAIDTATVAVTVTGTNDAPVAADDGFATHEDSSFVITKPDAIGNDSDVDAGAVLSVLALDTTGTMGSVTLHGNDGSISYDTNGQFESLAQDDIAVDIFSYTVQDEHGATDTATVTVTVTGVNDDPNAVADDVTLASGDSGAWGNVLDNDFDVDFGDTVSFTGFSFTDNNGLIHQGEFDDMLGGDLGYIVFDSQDAGHWSYHVTSGAGSGDDVFDYTIADSNGAAASGKLTISVSGTATSVVTSSVSSTDPVTTDTETPSDDTSAGDNSTPPAAAGAGTNSAPDAVADDAYVTYGNVLANDTDLDGDLLNVTGISFQGTSGELSDLVFGDYGFLMLDEGGNWTYTQNGTASANDVDVFDYTIADAHGAVDSSTLTVHAGDFIL
jgi:VCBS repeat-containing protein